MELLIAEGADVNAKGGWREWTPLHYAALNGNKEIVELLIAKGADMNVTANEEWTPLHTTASRRRWYSSTLARAKRVVWLQM
ncbi:ankyrin repeat domain-containing protein [bacterium]|nr:ankyrin repeat domain-containing protein [bacterium]